MKKIFNLQNSVFLLSLIVFNFIQQFVYGQDSTGSASSSQSTTTTTQSTTTVQPWVWVVGGIVLLIIIIALVRGGGSGGAHTDKVTYTKTTSSDDN
jgi:hypothetical protein